MYEGMPRRGDGTEYRRQQASPITRRPDRIALWAVAMAVIAMVAAATSAHARSGGTGTSSSCSDSPFGSRTLRLGDCGDDVKTLHWILKANSYRLSLNKDFDNPTDHSVRSFQDRHGLDADGVVGRSTRKQIVHTMPKAVATWYGPGFYGERTACGERLTRRTVGVANRRLPCGTRVTLKHHHRYLRTRVIDRGPYSNGARWDLTSKAAKKLDFTTTDTIRAAPIR
jgi:putative peptidoglycan binding protein/rare lipoprotein A (RlpA)-like double-psi beta-barrel protein